MIFNSPRMVTLRKKYQNEPKNRVPRMVYLDREPEFSDERQYLEDSISAFPTESRSKILGSLFSKNESQHIGAWFELILHGWLRDAQLGRISVEPEIDGQTPDFVIDTDTEEIIVEARALTKNETVRRKEQRESDISVALGSIQMPFFVKYKPVNLTGFIEHADIRDAVIDWLSVDPTEDFVYRDDRGNRVDFSIIERTNLNKILLMSPVEFFSVRADPVKRRLKTKSSKYRSIVDLGYPYVIALYLEPPYLSEKEIVTAWFGHQKYILDTNDNEVVDKQIDHSGIHYYRQQILHTSVSGTLVFRRTKDLQYPFIDSWSVENPYARIPIDNSLFPVESSFVVLSEDEHGYEMGWVKV